MARTIQFTRNISGFKKGQVKRLPDAHARIFILQGIAEDFVEQKVVVPVKKPAKEKVVEPAKEDIKPLAVEEKIEVNEDEPKARPRKNTYETREMTAEE